MTKTTTGDLLPLLQRKHRSKATEKMLHNGNWICLRIAGAGNLWIPFSRRRQGNDPDSPFRKYGTTGPRDCKRRHKPIKDLCDKVVRNHHKSRIINLAATEPHTM
jgi:hypothetical protein